MKKLFWLGVVLSCTCFASALGPPDGSLNITSDMRTVAVSTTAASPTLLLTRDSFIQRTWIINASTCTVFVSTASNIITTSSFGIPGSSTTPVIFTPDGVNAPWWGQLYGLSNCAAASNSNVSIFRSK